MLAVGMTDQLHAGCYVHKTVLCVDDERIGLRVRKIMLETHGFNVLTASDGLQGLPCSMRTKSTWWCSTTSCPT